MTFREMMAADLVHIFSTDCPTAAVYADPSGQTTDLTGELHGERIEIQDSNGIKTKLRITEFSFSTSDLSPVNHRGQMTIDSEDWSIAYVVHKDEVQTVVRLERHELHEHTRPDYRRR